MNDWDLVVVVVGLQEGLYRFHNPILSPLSSLGQPRPRTLTAESALLGPHAHQFAPLVSGFLEHPVMASFHHSCHRLILAPAVHTSLASLPCVPLVRIAVCQTDNLFFPLHL